MTLCLEIPTLIDSSLDTQALLDLGAACVQVARGNKMPLGTAWQDRGTTSLAVIDRWLAAGYNVGFLESGFIEREPDETDDELLSELLDDLETYYRDGKQYVSRIIFNERM